MSQNIKYNFYYVPDQVQNVENIYLLLTQHRFGAVRSKLNIRFILLSLLNRFNGFLSMAFTALTRALASSSVP
jgi:hypothetical protein